MTTKLKITLLLLLAVSSQAFAQCPVANPVTVNNTGDMGFGTLRWAITCVNSMPALTLIEFNIPGSTVIQPASPLPTLTKANALVDGNTQAVIIDGSTASGSNGLSISGNNITVQGLTIRDFTGSTSNGIAVNGGTGSTIQNNTTYNNRTGIAILNGNGHTVQSNTSYSNQIGITTFSNAFTFTISNNTVGLDSGNPAGNSSFGIHIQGTPTAGIVTGNTIAHNIGAGVNLLAGGTVLISENSIYCNVAKGINRMIGPAIPLNIKATTQKISGTAVAGQLIEVFEHSTAGCSGAIPCQGKTLLGTVTTPASGNWELSLNPGDIAAGSQVTASATQNGNNTSEFAACATVINCATLSANVNGNDVSCAGFSDGSASAMPLGGSPVYSYAWESGENTAAISGLMPNNYTVTVTDGNGCTVEQTVTVEEPPILIGSASSTDETAVNANDGTAQTNANGGSPPYKYLWSNGSMAAQLNNLAPGTYTVTITDQHNCSVIDVVSVSSFSCAGFTLSLTGTNIGCNGLATGSALANPAGGTPVYSYLWNTGASLPTLSGLAAGNYTVTATDQAGCTLVQNIGLTQPPVLTFTLSATDESAVNAHDGTATASGFGGTPGYTYSWNTGSISAQITNLAPGTYTVTVKDLNSCTTSGSITINAGPGGGACSALPVYAVLTPAEVCGNTSFTLETDDLYPSPDVQYFWYFPNGDSAVTTLPSLKLVAASTDFSGEYFVVRDSAGCRSIAVGGAPLEVLSLPAGQVSVGADTVICSDGLVILHAPTPALGTGNWVSLGAASVDNPGKTTTVGRDIQPGANTFVWRVSIGACPEAATDTITYFLEKAPLLQDDHYTIHRALDIAVMEVLLNDAIGGLQDTLVYQVNTPASGQLEYLENGHRFRYTAPEGFRGTVSFQYVVCDPGAICGFPCDTATVTIEVQNLPSVPEGLLLRDTEKNGRLTIAGIEGFSRVEVSIFNRWGALVFQEKAYDNDAPWTGEFKGKALPQGAYYYYLKAFEGERLIGGVQTGVIHLFENK